MRVVHAITKGDVGGAQTYVVELVAAQIAAGLAVGVIAGTDGPALERCRTLGAAATVVPSLGQARTRLSQRAALTDLRAAISAGVPDIVHAHSSNAGLLARIAARQLSIPCVYTAHGWPFQRGARWHQRVLSLAGEFVGGRVGDGVICLTHAEADRARRARVVRRDRLWVIPIGLSDVPESLVRRHVDQSPKLVMVARFAPPKQQRELIDLMASLTDLPWLLSFVGDGPELEACRGYGTALLGDRVQFLGHCDDVPAILAAHDVLVLLSAYEGLPISILEGMRAGLCCLASDLPGVRVLLGEGCGLAVGSADELARALRGVLVDPTLRARLGAAARTAFTERYSIVVIERQIRAVYETLLAGVPAKRRTS